MTANTAHGDAKAGTLAYVPPTVFTITMGVIGLGLAWRTAAQVLGLTPLIGETVIGVGCVVFLFSAAAYGAKTVLHRSSVAADFDHPVISNFTAAFTIALMLMAGALMPYSMPAANAVWLIGAISHFLLALRQLNFWVTRNCEIQSSNPAWFMPLAGNLLAPVSGVPLGYIEFSWCFFAFGLVFWILLFAIVLNRIIFHDQLPQKFVPTLFIMIAPPSLGFLSYFALQGGEIDAASRVLFHFALLTTLLVFSMLRLFSQLPFSLAWWAYTFPLAAMTIAALVYARETGEISIEWIAVVLLGVTSVIVLAVILRTLKALIDGTLFQPELE